MNEAERNEAVKLLTAHTNIPFRANHFNETYTIKSMIPGPIKPNIQDKMDKLFNDGCLKEKPIPNDIGQYYFGDNAIDLQKLQSLPVPKKSASFAL